MADTHPRDMRESALDELDATLPRTPNVTSGTKSPRGDTTAIRALSAHYPLPWRSIIKNALILWIVTRLSYILLTYLANGLPLSPGGLKAGPGFFGVWQRFDTNWYLDIATKGYAIVQDVAFFPLYPALIRVFMLVTGGNALIAALIVGNLGTLAALIGLGALVAWETRDAEQVPWAMLLALAFPFAFFFTTAYTEGLFLALAIFCLFFARREQWGWAALCALLAGASRPTGVILIPPLAWEWLRQNGLTNLDFWRAQLHEPAAALGAVWRRVWAALRQHWIGLLSIVAVPAFYAGFVVFVGIRFQHPSYVFNVHRDYWGIESAPIWETAYREITHIFLAPFASDTQVVMVLDTMTFLVVLGLVIAFWRSTPGLYNLYMLALLYLSIAQPTIIGIETNSGVQVLNSVGRFLLPAFPLFMALSPYIRKRPALLYALVIVSVLIQSYVALRFMTGVLFE